MFVHVPQDSSKQTENWIRLRFPGNEAIGEFLNIFSIFWRIRIHVVNVQRTGNEKTNEDLGGFVVEVPIRSSRHAHGTLEEGAEVFVSAFAYRMDDEGSQKSIGSRKTGVALTDWVDSQSARRQEVSTVDSDIRIDSTYFGVGVGWESHLSSGKEELITAFSISPTSQFIGEMKVLSVSVYFPKTS
ncbi:hypothetical protein K435DRAFT_879779 [Dendrothele bispora CBS 962.96]|uniref:Uncharacterized protein n=1 Tax=Dendrothele bispora (strain CBS 962.96) TaxID=1314807 RepID=A0A4S8KKT8_DENBC|nr:hypothetical protein K435DRAFT_879779 [Dendrothele bispora CBS 962.96]